MMKKVICLLLFGATFTGALFANGQSDEVPMTESGKTPVVFWTSHNEPDLSAMRTIIANYNAGRKEVEAELVQVSGDETDTTKLMTAVAGGTGPDVYLLDRFIVAQRAAEGMLVDITEYVEADGDPESEYLAYAWDEVLYKGRIYALPFDTDARVLYYNKTMIRDAGFDPAEFDMANGPMDIERFKEICFAINETDATGAYTKIGFNPFIEQAWHYTWAFAYGAEIFDFDTDRFVIDRELIDAFQFLYDWSADMGPQKNATWKSTYYPPDLPPANNPFIIERAATIISGNWFLKYIADYAPDMDWGMTYIPTPDRSKFSWSGGWSTVIPEGSKVPEAAYDFLSYFTGEEGQKVYLTETSHFPTLKSLIDQDELFSGDHKVFKQFLEFSQSRPATALGAFMWDQLTAVQDKMELNAQSPEDALVEIQEQINARMEQIR